MSWAWELPDWPDFRWDAEPLAPLEARFLHGAGRHTRHYLDVPELGRSDAL